MTKLTAAARATLAILTPADLAQLEHIRLRRGSGVSAHLDGYRAGIERAAKMMELTRSDVALIAGEMTAGEWRLIAALLRNRAAAIRALLK